MCIVRNWNSKKSSFRSWNDAEIGAVSWTLECVRWKIRALIKRACNTSLMRCDNTINILITMIWSGHQAHVSQWKSLSVECSRLLVYMRYGFVEYNFFLFFKHICPPIHVYIYESMSEEDMWSTPFELILNAKKSNTHVLHFLFTI